MDYVTPEEIAQQFPEFAKKYMESDFDIEPEEGMGQSMS